MAIITISRQLGSRGSIIAEKIKDELGYNFLEKKSLEKLMSKYGVSGEYVNTFDEKKPSFWENLALDKDRYFHFMKKAILDIAGEGDSIILGRGGQVILKNLPTILRLRIIAPMEQRLIRVKELYKCDNYNAEQIIKKNDQDRAGYHKFFFQTDWESPVLYDLIFNTRLFTEEMIVNIVKRLMTTRSFIEKKNKDERQLEDLCLEHEIISRIFYKENISIQFFDVISVSGTVTLRGASVSNKEILHCEETVKDISGVIDVKNEISLIPISYGVY